MNKKELKEKLETAEKLLTEVKAQLEGNLKVGDIVTYNNYEWYVIKEENSISTLMMKNKLPKSIIKKYFKHYDSYCDVEFSNNNDYDWANSNIREGINKFLRNEFTNCELLEMKTNYDEGKESKDFIRIPTLREIDTMNMEIRKIESEYGYWTMSPFRFYGSYARGFYVNASGILSSSGVGNSLGVRPVIALCSEILDNQ